MLTLFMLTAAIGLVPLLPSCAGKTVPSAQKSTASSKVVSSSSGTYGKVGASSASTSLISSQPSKTGGVSSSVPPHSTSHIICIDPGHQALVDTGTEPIAPGSTVMKIKNPGGAEGVRSKTPEYVINMLVSNKIQALLLKEGYTVVMTRADNNANISNIGRAKVANAAKADIFLRIHADSADSQQVKGASVLIPKAGYITDANLISKSTTIGTYIINGLVASTGTVSRGLSPRGDMTGFNWSEVPVVLVEMGFLSNPNEDELLNTDSYQNKIAVGIVNGVDSYFASKDSKS